MNSLAYNKFGDNGLRALALKFKLIPHLQILKLGNNHINETFNRGKSI